MSEIVPFNGFHEPEENWCKLPFELIAQLPRISSKAELCVILYVLRHTWGYREYEALKPITMDEFMNGRKRKDGKRIDAGIGMSEPSIREGLKSAQAHGFLQINTDDKDLGRVEKSYRLVMYDYTTIENEIQGERSLPPEESGGKKLTPWTKETYPRTEKDTLERYTEKEKDSFAPENGATEIPTAFEEKATEPEIKSGSHSETSSTQPGAAQPSERPLLISLCMELYQCPGGEAAKRADQLMGKAKSGAWLESIITPGMMFAEAKGWKLWIERSKHEVPRAAWQVQKSVIAFRAAQSYQDAITDANRPPRLPVVEEIPPPEVAAEHARLYRQAVAELAKAKVLTPERKPLVAA